MGLTHTSQAILGESKFFSQNYAFHGSTGTTCKNSKLGPWLGMVPVNNESHCLELRHEFLIYNSGNGMMK